MQNIFLPRGIRNNNSGNIRLGKIRWQGQRASQADPDFIEFDDPLCGVRALMRLLLTYHVKYQLDSVESIIRRYAPPRDNATDHYIYRVAGALGVKRNEAISLYRPDMLIRLSAAIIQQENGKAPKDRPSSWYAQDLYDRAAALALQPTTS